MKNKFFKSHSVIRTKKKLIIDNIIQGRFGFYFANKTIISFNQYKALIFFCRKKLKFYSKLFVRLIPKLKNTSKAIGIRMGKGKGSLNEVYFPVNEGQIFFEFGFKTGDISVINNDYDYIKLLKKIRELVKLASFKLSINLNYLISKK